MGEIADPEDRVLEEIRNDPDVEPRLHEMLQLEDLKEHPGWRYQRERFRNYKKATALTLARRLMSGLKIDPEQIAFIRGYAQGIEDVFNFPERLERDLERASQKAWERLQDEGAVSSENGEIPNQ